MKNIMHATRMSLPEKVRIEISDALNITLASTLDLYAQLKQAHWNIKGEGFMSLHLLLDTIAEEIEDQGDVIAERITAMGGTALGTIEAIKEHTTLREYPVDIFLIKDHIEHLTHNIAILGEDTRENVDLTDELIDMASNDICVGLLKMLDKNLWFLEAHIQK